MIAVGARWITYSSVGIAGIGAALLWLAVNEDAAQETQSALEGSQPHEQLLLPSPSTESVRISSCDFKNLTRLSSAATASEAKAAWRVSRQELLDYPDGSRAVNALKAALTSGENHILDTSLRVSPGGELQEAPSTRVYLMDLLAQLDSKQAAAYSRKVLQESTNSDEWAIALRNYTWGVDNAASDPFLREKVFQLLTNQVWVEQPTSGFLEAFDFVPYTQDPALVAPLVSLTKPGQPESVRRAAFLALARVFSSNSTIGLEGVNQAEADEPFSAVRADAMARADFTRPQDVDMVRAYLLSSRIDSAEFALFGETFPQGGQFAGPGLTTTFKPEPFSRLAKRDALARSMIEGWMQDPALSSRRAELSKIHERLLRLTASAKKGGYS